MGPSDDSLHRHDSSRRRERRHGGARGSESLRRREFLAGVGAAGFTAAGRSPLDGLPLGNNEYRRRWSFEVESDYLYYPAKLGDTVFVGSRGVAVGLSPSGGTERWRVDAGYNRLRPPVADGVAFPYREDVVYAVRPDGTERWSVEPDRGLVRGVAAAGDRVFVVAEEALVACDASTGDTVWRAEWNVQQSRRPGGAAPRVDGDAVLYTADAELVVRDAADGAVRWRHTIPENDPVDVALDGDEVYAYTPGTESVEAFALDDGDSLWSTTLDSSERSYGLFADGDAVYAVTDRLYALDAATGETRWDFVPDTGEFPFFSPATPAGETVYVATGASPGADAAGYLHALSAADAEERWRRDIGPTYGLTEVVDDAVYVQGGEALHGFGAADGERRWTFEPDERVLYPRSVDGTLYVGTRGALYAVDTPTAPLDSVVRAVAGPFEGNAAAVGAGAALGGLALGAAYLRNRRGATDDDGDGVAFGVLERLGGDGGVTVSKVRRRTPDGGSQVVARHEFDGVDENAFAAGVEAWREAAAVDGVAELVDWGTDPDPWFDVAYASGGTLADVPDPRDAARKPGAPDAERSSGGLDFEDRFHALVAACDVVHAGDRPHGAVRPGSVLLADADDPTDVRVADWGTGPIRRAARGRPSAFAPPEERPEAPTDRGDVYRLGAVGWFVGTGQPTPPDRADGPARDAGRSLGGNLQDVLRRATATNPADRFESPLALQDHLRWAAFVQRE